MTQLNPYQVLRLEHLAPSPTNPRKHFDPVDLGELAATIADHGVIEPIIVRVWPDEYDTPDGRLFEGRPLYEIVAGERRYRASLLAGCDDIPALVRPIDTRQVLEIQIVENLQRRGVNELEEAEGYDLMMREFGYTADELAAKVGKSRAYIYARLKLTALCEAAREAFRAGTLDASHALLIARIPGATLQGKALKDITEGWQGVMTYRNAANHIQNHYMHGLSRVVFALDDATLTPSAGPCTTCINRPCNTPELYPDVPPDRIADVCTDPDCLRTKTEAHLQRVADEAAAGGRQVVRAIPFADFFREFVEVDNEDHNLGDTIPVDEDGNDLPAELADQADTHRPPTRREALQSRGAQVEIVLVEHPHSHELIECVRRADYRQAVPLADAEGDDDDAPGEDARDAEGARRNALFLAIRGRYEDATHNWASKAATLRVIAQQFWARSWHNTRVRVAALNNITTDPHSGITHWLHEASATDLLQFLLDLALEPATDVPLYFNDIATPAPLLDMARALGIDPDNPAAEHFAAAKTPPPSPQAPRGSEVGDEEPTRAELAEKGISYCHPDRVELNWSGRGRKPEWVAAWLKNGGTLEQLSTAPQAAPADEQPHDQAAGAAKKTRKKTKTSGRVSAAGENDETTGTPTAHRCPNTPDMLEGAAA